MLPLASPALADEPAVGESNGYIGPVTELSGAWDDQVQNCMRVQTSLTKTAYDQATPEERDKLQELHEKFLTQFEHQKQIEPSGCDARFEALPILSSCDFQMPFAAVQTRHLDPESRALMTKYRDSGAVLFGYKYYNPETAIDDPQFEQRCTAINGVWQEVGRDSSDYQKSVELYEANAEITRQEQKAPNLTELFKPTDRE